MDKPLNLTKLKHQLNSLKSLRVSEQYVTNISSRFTLAKPAASPLGGSHFLLGFLHLQKRSGMAGGGAEGGNQLHLPRELQLLLQMAPESPL